MEIVVLSREEIASIVTMASVEAVKLALEKAKMVKWYTLSQVSKLQDVKESTLRNRCRNNYYGNDQKRENGRWYIKVF